MYDTTAPVPTKTQALPKGTDTTDVLLARAHALQRAVSTKQAQVTHDITPVHAADAGTSPAEWPGSPHGLRARRQASKQIDAFGNAFFDAVDADDLVEQVCAHTCKHKTALADTERGRQHTPWHATYHTVHAQEGDAPQCAHGWTTLGVSRGVSRALHCGGYLSQRMQQM